MTELKYDPELPFVVGFDKDPQTVVARFGNVHYAMNFARESGGAWIVDTTPKPKIPDDAEFIYYMSWANSAHYAKRVGHPNNHVWETSNPTSQISEEDLLIRIGDAEVIVLVRKEDS